jgi:exopolyphosphatase / guanosine-5'-triphosphate,3'-diphosphate pyrophosphatase
VPRIAVIDIGTNSVLYLLAETDRPGNAAPVQQEIRTTRLGRHLASSGLIADEDLASTIAVIREFKSLSEKRHADRLTCVGTRVFRKAGNSGEALRAIREGAGVSIEVLSEREEAEWSFRGAVHGRPFGLHRALVADIGGGSTELTFGTEGRPERSVSLPIGALVLTEAHLKSDPPAPGGHLALEEHIRSELAGRMFRPPENDFEFICSGGTATTLAALELGSARYDPAAVDGLELELKAVHRWISRLRPLDIGGKRTLVRTDPDRADILEAGLMILSAVMEYLSCPRVRVSDRGLRFGIVLRESELTVN